MDKKRKSRFAQDAPDELEAPAIKRVATEAARDPAPSSSLGIDVDAAAARAAEISRQLASKVRQRLT